MRYLMAVFTMMFALSLNVAPALADSDKKHYEKGEKYKAKQINRDHGSDDKSRDRRDHASKESKSKAHVYHAKPKPAKSSPYAERLKRAAEKRNRPTSR